MNGCVYLKKDLDWLTAGLSSFFDIKTMSSGYNGRKLRSLIKDSAETSWVNEGFRVIKNENKDPINREFFSNDSILLAIEKFDFIVFMDDDDFLLPGAYSEMEEAFESGADFVSWHCDEYDFFSGFARSSPYIKKEDLPSHCANSKILLPGAYAVSSGLLKRIHLNEKTEEIANFFSALSLANEMLVTKRVSIPFVLCFRPYIHFSEYYISDPSATTLYSGRVSGVSSSSLLIISLINELYNQSICH